MRQAGSIASSQDAQRLTAYLITQGIAAQVEQEGAQWAIWVREEDQVQKAKEELARYLTDPKNARYEGVEKAAAEQLREEASRRVQVQKNIRSPTNQWSDERVVAGPLTRVIIALCVMVFFLSGFGETQDGVVARTLSFIDRPSPTEMSGSNDDNMEKLAEQMKKRIALANDPSPLASIKRGEVWRLVTPIFNHLGFWHILFDLLMFQQLASLIESRRGTAVLGLVILATAVVSNLGQALMPAAWGGYPYFGGMSGVVYGLLGYAWMKTRYEPYLGIRIRDDVVFFLLLCMGILWLGDFTSIKELRVANWAHAYGFVSGVVIGYLPVLLRSMRT